DTLIDSFPKFDYLLEEFSGELAHTDPIPPGVVDTDLEPEEEIRLDENLSYDNSSPRPPEERNSEIAKHITTKKKHWSTKSTSWLSCNLEQFPTLSQLHAMGNVSSIPTSQPMASNAKDV
ncbi:hypothetical protein Tco_0193221, partial [Tanacetum coccineum]